jgi:hypothetical protein
MIVFFAIGVRRAACGDRHKIVRFFCSSKVSLFIFCSPKVSLFICLRRARGSYFIYNVITFCPLGSFACPKPYCSFLLLLQKKRTKEKEAGNDNFSLFWQNALGFTLPKKAEVHAISGLPARLKYKIRFIDHNSFYPKIL